MYTDYYIANLEFIKYLQLVIITKFVLIYYKVIIKQLIDVLLTSYHKLFGSTSNNQFGILITL